MLFLRSSDFAHFVNKILQRLQFLFVDQSKLDDKQYKVFEACVEMTLRAKPNNALEVRMVYMRVDTKESLEDSHYHLFSVDK